jgi:hypothetical protein
MNVVEIELYQILNEVHDLFHIYHSMHLYLLIIVQLKSLLEYISNRYIMHEIVQNQEIH